MIHLMKYIPKGVTTTVGRQVLLGRKNSPTILFVGGVVGVVATTVMASRATLKLDDVLEETRRNLKDAKSVSEMGRDDYSTDEYKQDVFYIYARATVDITKLYAPAVLLGAASIAALTGSHTILTRRNAGLTAAYAALDRAFGEYRNKVITKYGEDEDREFRYNIDEKVVVRPEDGVAVKVQRANPNQYSQYARFFDQSNPNFQPTPSYNFLFIKSQQNWANDLLQVRGHVLLNDVYEMLGIPRSREGAVVGWVISKAGDNYIDFGIFDGSKERVRAFVNGDEDSILLDFNVDGVIYDLI